MCIDIALGSRKPYGFLFKNDFNEFVYSCSRCDEEFRIGLDLEHHSVGHDVKLEDEIPDTTDLTPIEVIPQPALSDNGQAQPLLIELPKVEETAETDDPDDAESMEPLDDDFTPFQADDSSSDDEFLTPKIKIKKFPERKKSKAEKSPKKSTKSREDTGKLGSFECDICGRVLTSLTRIRKHMTTIHAAKKETAKQSIIPTVCKLCGKQIRYMKRHLQLCHSSERPFKCDQCDAKFKQKADWDNHARMHTGEKPFVCHLCGRSYHAKTSLNSHMRRSHPHLNPNAVERPFKCDYCDATYKQKVDRDIHVRRHTGEKPFVCETCGDRFRARSILIVHKKRQHLHLKPHKCDQCGKTYLQPFELRDHINYHHLNKKMYQCEVCERRFGTRKHLHQHSLSHGEKRHQCKFCDQKFATSSGRRGHETRKHGAD